MSDDELDNLMEGVAIPSEPNSLFASRHMPGANIEDDDDTTTGTTAAINPPATEEPTAESNAMDTTTAADLQPVVVVAAHSPESSSRTWSNVVRSIVTAPSTLL